MWRRAHIGAGYLLVAALLCVAVLLGVLQTGMAWAARNPARVDAWLEHRAGMPVAFARMRTHWTRSGPLVELTDLRLGEGTDAVRVGDARLLASIYGGLLPGRAFSQLRLAGLALTLERAPDGTWRARGLPGSRGEDGDALRALERLGELQVERARLTVLSPAHRLRVEVPRVDLRLRASATRLRVGVRAWPAADGASVDATLDFDRERGTGRAHLSAGRLSLREWAPVLATAGLEPLAGNGVLRAWANVERGRVTRVTARGVLRGVSVAGAPLDGRRPRVAMARVDLQGAWRPQATGWQARFDRLRLQQDDSVQTLDGLAIDGGREIRVAAERVDAGPLLQALVLSDRLPAAARRWLRDARPRAVVERLSVRRGSDGRARLSARLRDGAFDRIGRAPGLSGVAGTVTGDSGGLVLQFDRAARARISWPQAFGPDHVVRLDGRAVAWRAGNGIAVGAPRLHVAGEGYGFHVAGHLRWQGDGTRPFADLAATIAPMQLPVAKRFWVRHAMPAGVVRWLDNALVGGTLQDGRVRVVGDLDHWPFRAREGQFDARGTLRGARIAFAERWPLAEAVDAALAFHGDGFTLTGQGRVMEVPLRTVRASIDRYRGGRLAVDAGAVADAGQLLAMVKASPLRASEPATVDALQAQGPANVGFALRMPLVKGATTVIEGLVDLDGARLADRRWQLAFERVRGRARYDRSGFQAAELAVLHGGQPGRLALRAGPGHVRDSANAFEGQVSAAFTADELLAKAPDMAWLRPYVAGRSNWSVGVAVPRGGTARLQLRSNLVGTTLQLPAPLRKASAQPLQAFVDTPMPLGSGEINVALGQLVAVKARSSGGRTGVRVALGADSVAEPAPLQGLVATGRAPQLDAMEWIAFAARPATRGSGPGLAVQRLDVSTAQLTMLGGQFGEARVRMQPVAGASAVTVEGAGLDGQVRVPAGDGAVTGDFQRVHWKPLPRTGAAATAPTASGFDPRGIPGLSIDIADLRVSAARLGAARLRTRPGASGLVLEDFTATRGRQRIEASGDWSQAGGTRVDARVASDDFGALLAGFGAGGRVAGGQGSMHLRAAWPGGPADFAVAGLSGTLALDTRDGRLLEIEPGAGRVLGLLSLTDLPRRLTLDFRDFFAKGFSFNRLGGTVRFGGGLASSDDLGIRGPAADIDIRGSADLRRQSFDQTIEVRPKSGNLLTAVGALAGGPVGAAIGAAANAVLRKPLGQIGARTYRVTGPWKEPKVDVISRAQGRVAVASPAAG